MRTFMSWQDEYKGKLMTAEEAVKKVKSGDVVGFGLSLGSLMSSCPICTASLW
jgi:acyl-CoA hydrolase